MKLRLSLLLLNMILIFQVHASSVCDSTLLPHLDKNLSIDPNTQSIIWGSSVIAFSPIQLRALLVLSGNAPRIVSRDELAKLVWGSRGATNDDIRTVIVRIKKKFLEIDPQFNLIKNKYGRGYSWAQGEGKGEEIEQEFGPFTLYRERGFVRCRDKILELSPWEADFLSALSGQPLSFHPYRSFTQTSESSRAALITFRSKVSKLNTKFNTHFNLTQKIIKSKHGHYYMLNLETETYCY